MDQDFQKLECFCFSFFSYGQYSTQTLSLQLINRGNLCVSKGCHQKRLPNKSFNEPFNRDTDILNLILIQRAKENFEEIGC